MYYGQGTNVKSKQIYAAAQYQGMVTKDKDYVWSISGVFRQPKYGLYGATESTGNYSWTKYQPLYGPEVIYGKQIAIGELVADPEFSFGCTMTRAGKLLFHTYSTKESISASTKLTAVWENYLAGLLIPEDDRKVINIDLYERMKSVVATLKCGDSVLIESISNTIQMTLLPGVVKTVPGVQLKRSKNYMYDKTNAVFIPLYDDGTRDDIVNVWAIPHTDKKVYHYQDGTFFYDGTEIFPTAAVLDFVGSTDSLYAVYPGSPYVLERIFGTGLQTVECINYSYQEANTPPHYNYKVCQDPTGTIGSPELPAYVQWQFDTFTIIACSSTPSGVDISASWVTPDGLCSTWYQFENCSRSSVPGVRSGSYLGIELLAFTEDGVINVDTKAPKEIRTYTTNDEYFNDVTFNMSAFHDSNVLVSRGGLAETYCGIVNYTTTGDIHPKLGTEEDTKDWFTWADVRNTNIAQ
jgi:hypothetical protein